MSLLIKGARTPEAQVAPLTPTLKGAGTPEVIYAPLSRPHLIDHIFGARITLILLFASLIY